MKEEKERNRTKNREVVGRTCKFIFIMAIIVGALIFAILWLTSHRCFITRELYCRDRDKFYSALGVAIGAIVTMVVFILSFLQTLISLHENKIHGIEMKRLFKMVRIGKTILLVCMFSILFLIGASIVTYLWRDIFWTLIWTTTLFFISLITIFIEISLIYADENTMYSIISLVAAIEIMNKSSIAKTKKEEVNEVEEAKDETKEK